jgi:predicted solute-binding protein
MYAHVHVACKLALTLVTPRSPETFPMSRHVGRRQSFCFAHGTQNRHRTICQGRVTLSFISSILFQRFHSLRNKPYVVSQHSVLSASATQTSSAFSMPDRRVHQEICYWTKK